jgi:hypothetical protein
MQRRLTPGITRRAFNVITAKLKMTVSLIRGRVQSVVQVRACAPRPQRAAIQLFYALDQPTRQLMPTSTGCIAKIAS